MRVKYEKFVKIMKKKRQNMYVIGEDLEDLKGVYDEDKNFWQTNLSD